MSDWFERMRKATGATIPLPGAELLLFGPAQAVQLAATAVKASLAGRRRTYRLAGREVTTELVDLSIGTGPGLAVGQLEDARIVLKDLDWDGRRVSSLRITGRNVHLRPGLTPTLVAAPVHVEATIASDDIPTWSPAWTQRFTLEIGDDAVARIHVRDREHLGALEVDIRCEGSMLVVEPAALRAGKRRFGGLRRLPPFRVPIVLPRGIRVTDIALAPGAVTVHALVPEWSESLVVTDLQQFARLLRPDLDPVIVPLRKR